MAGNHVPWLYTIRIKTAGVVVVVIVVNAVVVNAKFYIAVAFV